jgi:hypothetical protein
MTIPLKASDIDNSTHDHLLFEDKSVVEIEYRSKGASNDDVVAVVADVLHFEVREREVSQER